ncbi:Aldehyde dehydrogenase, C-terminal, partial [Trema orientale]
MCMSDSNFDQCTNADYCFQSNVGAKNHVVVMPDASMDATLNALLVAFSFGAIVQKCMTLNAIVFVRGVNP